MSIDHGIIDRITVTSWHERKYDELAAGRQMSLRPSLFVTVQTYTAELSYFRSMLVKYFSCLMPANLQHWHLYKSSCRMPPWGNVSNGPLASLQGPMVHTCTSHQMVTINVGIYNFGKPVRIAFHHLSFETNSVQMRHTLQMDPSQPKLTTQWYSARPAV